MARRLRGRAEPGAARTSGAGSAAVALALVALAAAAGRCFCTAAAGARTPLLQFGGGVRGRGVPLTAVLADAAPATTIVAADPPAKTVIVGGGPAGLSTALALARRGWKNIHVYDRLAAPPDPDDEVVFSDTARFYLIGLGGRGQKALREIDAWDEVLRYASPVVGRRDWAPGSDPDEGVERIFTERPYTTQVLARDRLAGVLKRLLTQRHADAVQLHYGVECTGVSWETHSDGKAEVAKLVLQRCGASAASPGEEECAVEGEPFEEVTPFLVGADGAARAVAHAVESEDARLHRRRPFRITRYEDDNVRVYKTVPMKLPKGWRGDINYSARTKDARVVFDALPADRHGTYCGVLLLREGDPLARADTPAAELRAAMDELLPQFSKLVADDVLEAVAKRPPSRLPSFRYAGPRLHFGESTVLLGDAVHTVKPYFGLGANSALEDVIELDASLNEASGSLGAGLQRFTERRGKEAETLVRISRSFDRPGFLGFVTFILPIILDAIFGKLAPKVFAANTISMLQLPSLSFQDVASRKRQDRILQVLVLVSVLGGIGAGAVAGVRALLGLGRQGLTVVGCAAVAGVAAVGLRRWIAGTRHMAAADIMAKADKKSRGGGAVDGGSVLMRVEAQAKAAAASGSTRPGQGQPVPV